MIRTIIKIDEEKCNGCGLCVTACHEGAIGINDGKAVLLRDDYCDGLGNCLPVCPTDAISFEEREALAFDEEAVQLRQAELQKTAAQSPMAQQDNEKLPCGCPGSQSKTLHKEDVSKTVPPAPAQAISSQLAQWPVQIKLVPVNAPYFHNANLLIAADCAAYAYGNFHNEFMQNKITIIGCPKLDEGDYSDKLTTILQANEIKSVTIVRMEVPCCGGIEFAAKTALKNSGKMIPWQVVTISTDGSLLD